MEWVAYPGELTSPVEAALDEALKEVGSAVREAVEHGFAEAGTEGFPTRAGLGGVAMFVSGTVGGLLNPLHRPVISRDGTSISDNDQCSGDTAQP